MEKAGSGKPDLQLKYPEELMNPRNLQEISSSKESAYLQI